MFLSKLNVNSSRVSVVHLLQSAENIHACIAGSTPGSLRPLWRMDVTSHGRVIYVVSDSLPDFTGFKERYGYPSLDDSATFQIADYGKLMDSIEKNQQWYFEVVVNPTVKRKGKVVPLLTKEDAPLNASSWLSKKLSQAATVDDMSLVDERVFLVNKRNSSHKGGSSYVKFKAVRYRGKITVDNAEELRDMLIHGIGREKAYGCGLLTLYPCRQ